MITGLEQNIFDLTPDVDLDRQACWPLSRLVVPRVDDATLAAHGDGRPAAQQHFAAAVILLRLALHR
jgi:hypothetical protein